METTDANAWVCMQCGARQEAADACRVCGDEPLLDARRPQTLEVLADDDVTRRDRRQDRLRYGAIPFAIVLTILMAVYVPGVNQVLLSLPFFTGYPVGMALLAFGLIVAFNRLFPFRPRFPFASP